MRNADKRVQHISIIRGNGNSVRIHVPVEVRELLGHPVAMCIKEHPLRLMVAGTFSGNAHKLHGTDGGTLVYAPPYSNDDVLGLYNYEIDDMTVYLDKIQ